jgi:hypothetical protein
MSLKQIRISCDFCWLEVQCIADGDKRWLASKDYPTNKQLTQDIDRGEADPTYKLKQLFHSWIG